MVWFFLTKDSSPPPSSSESATAPSSDSSTPLALTGRGDEAVTTGATLPGNQEDLPATPLSPALPDVTSLPAATETVVSFYQTLDGQPYIHTKKLSIPSAAYATRLLHTALSNPPIATRETDDLLTVLKNSAHFYRLFGKENILLIKEILTNEQTRIEDILANSFLLLHHPDQLTGDLALHLPPETIDNAAYAYACFFLNTMGGRSYLLRRDARIRILTTYYAIMTIEMANEAGKNHTGQPLQPALDLLTAEMETSGVLLRYKDAYLDHLYDLKEKYQ